LIETYFNKLAATIGEDKKPGSSLGEDFPKPLDLLKWLDLVPPDDGPTLVELSRHLNPEPRSKNPNIHKCLVLRTLGSFELLIALFDCHILQDSLRGTLSRTPIKWLKQVLIYRKSLPLEA
jgi:hypothetical protein